GRGDQLSRLPPVQRPGRGELTMTQPTGATPAVGADAPAQPGRIPAAPKPAGRRRSGTWWRHLLALLTLVWALFPVLFILSAALNPAGTLSSSSPFPQHFSGSNFTRLFESTTFPYWTWFTNSLIVAGL